MGRIRTIVVAFIVLSVAMLPVAGVEAYVHSSEMSLVSAQADCCPQGQHCDKHAKGDCAKLPGCELKCSGGFSAALPTPLGLALGPSRSQETALAMRRATSLAFIPPSPPPRV